MDLDLIRGLIIIILMVSFVGMAIWLWFYADREKLEQASRMPLDDEQQTTGRSERGSGGNNIEEAGRE